MTTSRIRRLGVNTLVLAGAVAVFLAMLEGAVRLFGLAQQTAYFYQPDQAIGARLIPGALGRWRQEEFDVEVSVNRLGFRDRDHARTKPPGTRRVAFLGDSYLEAMQVPLERTFFRLFEDYGAPGDRPVESLAFGVAGFGTAQEYLAWKTYAAPFEPDLVVLTFLPGNDFRNNLYELQGDGQRPYFLPRGEGLELVWPGGPPHPFHWWQRAIRKVFFPQSAAWLRLKARQFREGFGWRRMPSGVPLDFLVYAEPPPPPWEQSWLVTERLLRRFRDETRTAGSRFLVMILDDGQEQVEGSLGESLARRFPLPGASWNPDGPTRRLAEFCRREGIDCLDLLAVLRLEYTRNPRRFHYRKDGHWNEEGHRVAARALRDHLLADPVWSPPDGG